MAKKGILIWIMIMSLLIQSASAGEVTRTIPGGTVAPGEAVTVTLEVSLDPGEAYYAIDEAYDPAFSLTDPGEGDTTEAGRLKWIVCGVCDEIEMSEDDPPEEVCMLYSQAGPERCDCCVPEASGTTYSYVLQAPSQEGVHEGWSGIFMLEGMGSEAAISGDPGIVVEAACEPSEEVCDGEDNDCDGETDEGLECSPQEPEASESCSDGTPFGECSQDRPSFCLEGDLVERASLCGCPSGYKRDGDVCFKDEDPSGSSPSGGSSGSSSGGGGGCWPEWECSGWGPCRPDGHQERSCEDIKSCGRDIMRPDESQACDYEPPEEPCQEAWDCSDWSTCEDGRQQRLCSDSNECGSGGGKPPESRSCEVLSETTGHAVLDPLIGWYGLIAIAMLAFLGIAYKTGRVSPGPFNGKLNQLRKRG